MKYCPKCGYETDDEEILYCAEDGQLLVEKKQRKPRTTKIVNTEAESKKDEQPEEAKAFQEQTNKSNEQSISNTPPATKQTNGKPIVLSILLIISIIVCFVLNNQREKEKDNYNESYNEIYDEFLKYHDYCTELPEIQIIAHNFYSCDKDGKNIQLRPFYTSKIEYICCNYSVIKNPYYYIDEDDYLTIKIKNATKDRELISFNQFLYENYFDYGAPYKYWWDSGCWYIVQWIYDDELIFEKSFFVN